MHAESIRVAAMAPPPTAGAAEPAPEPEPAFEPLVARAPEPETRSGAVARVYRESDGAEARARDLDGARCRNCSRRSRTRIRIAPEAPVSTDPFAGFAPAAKPAAAPDFSFDLATAFHDGAGSEAGPSARPRLRRDSNWSWTPGPSPNRLSRRSPRRTSSRSRPSSRSRRAGAGRRSRRTGARAGAGFEPEARRLHLAPEAVLPKTPDRIPPSSRRSPASSGSSARFSRCARDVVIVPPQPSPRAWRASARRRAPGAVSTRSSSRTCPNVQYLTGFIGIGRRGDRPAPRLPARRGLPLRDGRVNELTASPRRSSSRVETFERSYDEAIVEICCGGKGALRIGIEAAYLPVSRFNAISAGLAAAAPLPLRLGRGHAGAGADRAPGRAGADH